MQWTLYNTQVVGEQIWESWRMPVADGTAYRESLTILDGNSHIIKSFAETEFFVADSPASLSWQLQKIVQVGEKLEKLYSASITGGTAFLTLVVFVDKVTSVIKLGFIDSVVFSTDTLSEIMYLSSSPTAGGDVTETLTVAGLLSTDVVLSVTPKATGDGPPPSIAPGTPAANSLPATFSNDPGAGMIATVTIQRAP